MYSIRKVERLMIIINDTIHHVIYHQVGHNLKFFQNPFFDENEQIVDFLVLKL